MNQKKALSNKNNDYSLLEKKYLKFTKSELLDPFSVPPVIKLDKDTTATIVIPGKNVESSILACLVAIEQSSFNIKYPDKLQVIVVDDGSDDKTWKIIKSNKFALNLVILRQEHSGQSQALNTGISVAENEIIISCDADMILSYYTIEHLMIRHQMFPDVLLAGFRSEVYKDDHRVNPLYIRHLGTHRYPTLITDERIVFSSSGYPNNMCLASNHYKDLGHLNGLWMRNNNDPWLLSDLVFGALFSLPKKTYYEIGGFDERFVDYGCSDGYLVSKAISVGKFVLPVYSATGLHISHSSRTENKLLEYKNNRRTFYKLLKSSQINTYPNWLAEAKNRIIEQINKKPSPVILPKKDITNKILLSKYLKIDTLLAVGQYHEVIAQISKDKNTKDERLLLELGCAYLSLKKYNHAIDIFGKLSNTQNSYLDLLQAQAAIGKFSDAEKTLNKYIQDADTSEDIIYWNQKPEFYIQQGILFFKQNFYEIALKCFEIALVKQHSNKFALRYRDKCLEKIILSLN
ncbi:MAG: glycosyltransferase family 2 protein [bacterium]|nr:glycosyltransferase family 2 protein [bacterium]